MCCSCCLLFRLRCCSKLQQSVPDTCSCCACPLQYEHPHERYGMPMGGPHDPKQHAGYGRDHSYSHDETAVDQDYYRQQGGGLERQTSGNYGKSSQKVAGLPDIASSRWVDCGWTVGGPWVDCGWTVGGLWARASACCCRCCGHHCGSSAAACFSCAAGWHRVRPLLRACSSGEVHMLAHAGTWLRQWLHDCMRCARC